MSHPTSLAAWLAYLETLHPKAIALGLERVRAVYSRLGIAPACPVITVGGTNGKGSTSTFLERMLSAGGYRVGLYTSPHLLHYNERVRIVGTDAGDGELCAAFAAVEAVRGDTPLTYFEFGTLATLWLFAQARLDAWVLEVGLGGRLDAVNIVDADMTSSWRPTTFVPTSTCPWSDVTTSPVPSGRASKRSPTSRSAARTSAS